MDRYINLLTRLGLVALVAAPIMLAAFAAVQWPYTLNMWRLARQGWITTVDKDIFAPDARLVYKPIETVAGDPEGAPLPRSGDAVLQSRFAGVVAYANTKESYALLVWSKGALVLEHYGPGASAEAHPDSASMHKSVTALALGAAFGKGLIAGLDEPVGTYISEWHEEPRGTMTLRDVMGMASGLDKTSNAGGPFSESNQFLAGFNADEIVLNRPLIARPGTAFAYRNINTQLLGLILERATKKRYAEFLSEALWKPIGAGDAAVWLHGPGGTARHYTALMARPEDWLRIGLLIKNRGLVGDKQVVPAEWIDAMLTPSKLYPNYGLQVWFARPYLPMRYYNPSKPGLGSPAKDKWGTDDMVFFDGVGGQRVYISRSEDLVIVRLGVARTDWDDSVLTNVVMAALAPAR